VPTVGHASSLSYVGHASSFSDNSSRKCNARSTKPSDLAGRSGCLYLLILLLLLGTGCDYKLDRQPRLDPLEESDFFEDGMGSRPLVPGTVPRGPERDTWVVYSRHYTTGLEQGRPAENFPPEIFERWEAVQMLERGRERYRVFCSHCHDLTGSGNGVVPRRGFPMPPTFHSERLREAPVGHFYQVISDGIGQMPPHRSQVPPHDRWAIAAYIRALQLAQYADVETLDFPMPLNDQPRNDRP
jgi:mono/diheme cytochrome c family protein